MRVGLEIVLALLVKLGIGNKGMFCFKPQLGDVFNACMVSSWGLAISMATYDI